MIRTKTRLTVILVSNVILSVIAMDGDSPEGPLYHCLSTQFSWTATLLVDREKPVVAGRGCGEEILRKASVLVQGKTTNTFVAYAIKVIAYRFLWWLDPIDQQGVVHPSTSQQAACSAASCFSAGQIP